jgi:hypothetical protein
MRHTGDPEGITVLKALHTENRQYLKLLMGEAKSNFDLRTHFKDRDEKAWTLKLDVATGDLEISASG